MFLCPAMLATGLNTAPMYIIEGKAKRKRKQIVWGVKDIKNCIICQI